MKKILIGTSAFILLSLTFLITHNCNNYRNNELNEYRVSLSSTINAIDPVKKKGPYDNYAASLIFEGLYSYFFDGKKHNLITVLAESLPELSDNNKVFTIKLKKGVYFTEDPAFGTKKENLL